MSPKEKMPPQKRKPIWAKIGYARNAKVTRAIAQTCYRASFFSISLELKFHEGLPKKSSRSDQPLPRNLLKTISPFHHCKCQSWNSRLNTSDMLLSTSMSLGSTWLCSTMHTNFLKSHFVACLQGQRGVASACGLVGSGEPKYHANGLMCCFNSSYMKYCCNSKWLILCKLCER